MVLTLTALYLFGFSTHVAIGWNGGGLMVLPILASMAAVVSLMVLLITTLSEP